MTNIELAQAVLTEAYAHGVREIVVCAGARNAPFVKLLSGDSPFKVYSFFEERSAGFFALGRMQAEGRPVAVVTTSGTAAAELLPACIEADYQRLPLLMITADRPRRFRGCGAPQTIVQPGIFSHYVGAQADIEADWIPGPLQSFSVKRPVHLNICFDEPLIDAEPLAWVTREEKKSEKPVVTKTPFFECKSPLVVVGGLTAGEAEKLTAILHNWKRPLYVEGPSRLRGKFPQFEIHAGEKTIANLKFDGVIRIGSVPTLRYWRDLEKSSLPVYNFSSLPFSGLSRAAEVHPLSALPENPKFEFWNAEEKQKDRDLSRRLEILFKEFPNSEPAWMQWLSHQVPAGARLFIGNSLPVREWDFAAHNLAARDVFANRGTNGIDGLISTFAGAAHATAPNWAIIGDLSLMYDMSGPWALRQRPLTEFNLVVINNGGGQIFHRMFRNPLFLNEHRLRFANWAKMWDLEYRALKDTREELKAGRQVIEVLPDFEQTEAFWKAWEASH